MVGPNEPGRPPRDRARGRALLGVLLLAAAVAAAGCQRRAGLTDLEGIAELQAQFNRDGGKPRIVLLLSPT